MKHTLNTYQIAEEIRNNANFSGAGALALAEYLEDYEEETGEELELDVVAIRGDFAEYDCAINAMNDLGYFSDYEHDETTEHDEEEEEEDALEYLRKKTTVITFDGGIIVQSF